MTDHDDDAVDCRRLETLIGDYVDDRLPGHVKGAVDEHMGQCAPCMAFLKQYRFAPEAARRMLLRAVPKELEERVLSFLRQKCTKK
jgi:hypothetical protein